MFLNSGKFWISQDAAPICFAFCVLFGSVIFFHRNHLDPTKTRKCSLSSKLPSACGIRNCSSYPCNILACTIFRANVYIWTGGVVLPIRPLGCAVSQPRGIRKRVIHFCAPLVCTAKWYRIRILAPCCVCPLCSTGVIWITKKKLPRIGRNLPRTGRKMLLLKRFSTTRCPIFLFSSGHQTAF